MHFVHDTLAQRVRFGSGAAAEHVAAEFAELGSPRVMLIAAASEEAIAGRVTAGIEVVRQHDDVAMHVPVEVAERARRAAVDARAELIVSVGGGSTTGLAKAVALTSGIPILAVPTTYAGSEATNVWGLTEGGRKTTGVDPRVLPACVVYDAELTLSLPVALSVASGLNALAHCIDSFWAPRADPINAALAVEGIRALAEGLTQVADRPDDLGGRELTLYAAYLAAVAFASAGSGLHHKICHYLGGAYDLPHAETHAVVLPYVLALNGPASPRAERRIAAALGDNDALSGLTGLCQRLGAPRALEDLGLAREALGPAAAAIAAVVPDANPRAVDEGDLQRLLEAAWAGSDPRALAREVVQR